MLILHRGSGSPTDRITLPFVTNLFKPLTKTLPLLYRRVPLQKGGIGQVLARKDGRVILDGGVCCARASLYWRIRYSICILVEVGCFLIAVFPLHSVVFASDWRRPSQPTPIADYATYVRIVKWFLDTPDPQAPFSVHRMALAVKELGKEVGQWFGPSTAAGAIKYALNSLCLSLWYESQLE